jgi:ATPases involved in chromosome partitioning
MILAVTGGKGGVGKSTVAYNLAAELDAVAVDGDLGMADLPASRGPDLHDVLAGRASAVEAVREGGPVALLPCGRSLSGLRAVDLTAFVDVLDQVADAYGRVVVDCPAGLGSDVGLALSASEACVLVTTPDTSAIADAVRARALARELDAGLVRVVLNCVHSVDEPAPTDALARELGAPVTVLPESDALAAAQRRGVPVGQSAPGSLVADRVGSLADAVQSSLSAW